MHGGRGRPQLARLYFTRLAHYGRRVVFARRPADASPHHPLTTPWPDADELTEGVELHPINTGRPGAPRRPRTTR